MDYLLEVCGSGQRETNRRPRSRRRNVENITSVACSTRSIFSWLLTRLGLLSSGLRKTQEGESFYIPACLWTLGRQFRLQRNRPTPSRDGSTNEIRLRSIARAILASIRPRCAGRVSYFRSTPKMNIPVTLLVVLLLFFFLRPVLPHPFLETLSFSFHFSTLFLSSLHSFIVIILLRTALNDMTILSPPLLLSSIVSLHYIIFRLPFTL